MLYVYVRLADPLPALWQPTLHLPGVPKRHWEYKLSVTGYKCQLSRHQGQLSQHLYALTLHPALIMNNAENNKLRFFNGEAEVKGHHSLVQDAAVVAGSLGWSEWVE